MAIFFGFLKDVRAPMEEAAAQGDLAERFAGDLSDVRRNTVREIGPIKPAFGVELPA